MTSIVDNNPFLPYSSLFPHPVRLHTFGSRIDALSLATFPLDSLFCLCLLFQPDVLSILTEQNAQKGQINLQPVIKLPFYCFVFSTVPSHLFV